MLGIKNIDLLDTLYGGLAGTLSQPDFINQDDDLIADSKQSLPEHAMPNSPPPEYEVVPTEEVFAASLDQDVDIV